MTRFFFMLFLLCSQQIVAQSIGWTFALKPSVGVGGVKKLEKVDADRTTDGFRYGASYGFGFRTGWRFSKFLSINTDLEWQRIQDRRTRIANNIATGGVGSYVSTTEYINSFDRFQVPVALHIYPFPKKSSGFLRVGVMPSIISRGNIKYAQSTTKTGDIEDSGRLKADFDIPANQGIERDLIFFTGLGASVTNRFSMELIYQFNKPMAYATFDPGNTFVGVPVYSIWANQGLMLSVLYKFN